MREYTITLANKKDVARYYEGYNTIGLNTIEVIVEANNEEEAKAMVEGYKGKTVIEVK